MDGWTFLWLWIGILLSMTQALHPEERSCVTRSGKKCDQPPKHHAANRNVELGLLPGDLWPDHTDLELRTELTALGSPPFPFNGTVHIHMECITDTDVIYVNQRDLSVDPDSILLELAPDSPIQPQVPQWVTMELDQEMYFLILSLDGSLVAGAKYRLTMAFASTLAPSEGGYYWDSYVENGETRYLAVAHFHPHSARAAFPCFDEPAIKSTYNITLVRMSEMTALSSMPIIAQEDRDEGWVADIFQLSPVMSAYLVCFAICDFSHVETVSPNGHLNGIWARADIIHAANYTLSIVGETVDWFEEYTGVPYTLPKLDHFAPPSKGGAMENWGLITYRENGLLWDPDWSTSDSLDSVTSLVAHEVAHMWFGNLVTYAWWSHTWLSEGFATFFGDRPSEGVVGWAWNEINLVDTVHPIMIADESNSSIPVRIEVDSPWEAMSTFSSFTYSKGCAVVKMLYQILGEESFRRGLNRYLIRHAYQAVYTDDLWAALTEQAAEDGITDTDGSPLDFKEKMDPYVDQRGIPLVTIHREEGGVAHAYQTYFLNPPDQEVNDPSPFGETWHIPLTFATEEQPGWNTNTRVWMDRGNVTITEDIPDSTSQWLVANVEYKGYYMVDYDTAGREALVRQLVSDPQIIAPENRAGFIHDTFRMIRADYYNEVVGYETTQHLGADFDMSPWVTAEKQLETSTLLLTRYQGTYGLLQSYMRGLVDPVYTDVGWDKEIDEPFERSYLRVTVIRIACSYDNNDCLQQSTAQYDQWKQDINNNQISTDHRAAVYCSAIRMGDVTDFDHAHQAYLLVVGSNHGYASTEKNQLLAAMACTGDTDILQRYLDMTFDPDQIRANDAQRVWNDIASSDYGGRQFMWEYLQINWRDPDVVPSGVSKNTVFLNTVDSFASDEDLQELNTFIETYPPEDTAEENTYNQAVNQAQTNNQWAQKNQQELHDWLQEHAPPGGLLMYDTASTHTV